MYRNLISGLFVIVMVSISGCATNLYPGGATPSGLLISSTTATSQALSLNTDPTISPDKVGEASSAAFLGLFGFGNSSVTAAMIDGGITTVHHVDYRNMSVLSGLFLQTTTIVYGE
ncbi:hypothetical protein A9Q81_24120 [Gammaproteobacteria bacterium 42_54_T18]|nr:hypothetical protein A9Q81_24120 [Gammaproteobacteria bacterium 42_54_T18]